MNDSFFLDTNTLVYSFDNKDSFKRKVSQQLVQHALSTRKGHISYQVVQEFLNVAMRKFPGPMEHPKSSMYLHDVLSPLCTVFPTMMLYEKALQIHTRWKFSFFDSLIVASALTANCSILLSEDLQHKQKIETLTVVNPFIENNTIQESVASYTVVSAAV